MEISSSLRSWIKSEFNDIDFGDLRLNKRFIEVTQGLASNSEKNISSAFDSWKDIKACYRFFSNNKVDASDILLPHLEKTLERVRNQKRVLFIQDTVVFSLGDRPGSNNLCLCSKNYSSKKPIRGLILHELLALNDKGLPLGIIHQEFIDRQSFKDKGRLTKTQYQRLPISQKESKRWPEFIKISKALNTGEAQIIHIADREGDIYELYRDCLNWEENFLIRASHDRSINKKKRRGVHSNEKLFELLETSRDQGVVSIQVSSSKQGKKYRKANLSIIYKKISIPPPPNRTLNNSDNNLPMLEMTAIMALERKAIKNEPAIKWVLLTNLPITSLEDAKDKIKLYSMRWNIELLHKIMKSGFSMEKSQLRDGVRLKKYITLKSILSWRIFWLTRFFRESKEKSCELVLTSHEWKVLFLKFNRRKILPTSPPKIKEVYIWIGKLGGFIGRNNDGDPGFVSIWRGWMRFMDLLEFHEAFYG